MAAATATRLPETIKLQLRKPKSWHWELTTSKSSPAITMPVIQLYDYRGKLLIEAKESPEDASKSNKQKIWRSKERDLQQTGAKSGPGSSRRSRSRSNISTEGLRRTESDRILEKNPETRKPKKNRTPNASETSKLQYNNEISNVQLEEFLHKKRYTTRTSSAGTLIIPEESFRTDPRRSRRRRRRRGGSYGLESLAEVRDSAARTSVSSERDRKDARLRGFSEEKHIGRNSNREGFLSREKPSVDRSTSTPEGGQFHGKKRYSSKNQSFPGLFYSQSEVFPFERVLKCDENNNNDRITVAGKSGGNSGKTRRKRKNRTVDRTRRSSFSSTSSTSSGEVQIYRRKGHLIREHSASKRDKQPGGGETVSSNTDDLLNLVRRLSYSHQAHERPLDAVRDAEHDVNMGANVSRHSAKGLGRRSQSSGSICNGGGTGSVGRHPDGKICSSLPSYLDDRDKTGASCNNNHHGKRPPDDERIPPLGDSAPLHWKFSDTQIICDQGYGSERSPEEEYPPPLPGLEQEVMQCLHHLEPHACYPFITPDGTFLVKLVKGSRGLGLSVTGGIDSTGSWPGLIRIKRLFPHQPASACGLLNVGDLLLEANGVALTGLTNYEALEVLRTAPNHVELKVCRPPPDVLNCVSPISEVPPPPPRREPPNTLSLPSNSYVTPEDDQYHGEFEITLKKIQGSLGFTLRKEDDSALGHYVRALVREPALTDGRIRAGDKIIAVNDVEICPMSHEQAVQFLRQCPDIVKLRLYRDSAQTPVATLSPTETTPRNSFSRKAHLRQEAMDMLNDLAGRKLVVMASSEGCDQPQSPTSSLRRRPRRPPAHPEPVQLEQDYQLAGQSDDYVDYQEQFHEGMIQICPRPFDDDIYSSLFTDEPDEEGDDRPNRPSSLELYNPNQTPVACRKPRFNFSLAHNAYELNNLDAEVLDAPNLTYNLCNEDVKTSDSEIQEPVSMPQISTTNGHFNHKHPAYQSAHPQIPADHAPIQPQTQLQPAKTAPDAPADGTLKRRKNNAAAVETKRHISHAMPMKEEYQVLAIELNRGWNSRLGFSLQGAAGVTYVSAVHADSVASRDGRLKPGDRLIKVNDESIEHMSTSEIIDLLRIVRGPVCIVISRVKTTEDCLKSNAEN